MRHLRSVTLLLLVVVLSFGLAKNMPEIYLMVVRGTKNSQAGPVDQPNVADRQKSAL